MSGIEPSIAPNRCHQPLAQPIVSAAELTVLEAATIATGGWQELAQLVAADLQVAGTTVAAIRVVEIDVDGGPVVEPGGIYSIGSVLAGSSSPLVFYSYSWEEEPIAA
jgi:hypothetical protein